MTETKRALLDVLKILKDAGWDKQWAELISYDPQTRRYAWKGKEKDSKGEWIDVDESGTALATDGKPVQLGTVVPLSMSNSGEWQIDED